MGDCTRLLDARELGRQLSIKPHTLLSWARKHQIPHYRLGDRLVRFRLEEVRAWLLERRLEASG